MSDQDPTRDPGRPGDPPPPPPGYQPPPGQQGGQPGYPQAYSQGYTQGYTQGAYPTPGSPPGPPPRNGTGTAALVLGIIALITGLGGFLVLTIVLAVVCGILAVVLGIVGRRRATRGEATNGGVAITGAVLGLVGVLAGVAWAVFGVWLYDRVEPCAQYPSGSVQQQQCLEDRLNAS